MSLILTAATGAGLLTLYNYIVAEKLQGKWPTSVSMPSRHAAPAHVRPTSAYMDINVHAQEARSRRRL